MEQHAQESELKQQARLDLAEEILASEQASYLLNDVQRLAGIGALASSIAQELADILSIITAANNGLRYELQHSDAATPEALQHYMNLIERNAFRGARIAAILRDYSTADEPQMAVTDVEVILSETLMLVERQFREEYGIRIVVKRPQETRSIVCDHNRIIQLLLILLTNARDAMLPNGRRIDMAVRLIRAGELESLPGLEYLPVATIDRFAIVVADEGPGIPNTLQEQIFTPFFSTHANGQGAGLGLSVAQDIVREHDGRIWATNKNGPAKGATVVVVLPGRPSP